MKDIMDLIECGRVKSYFRAREKLSFEGAISHITQHSSGNESLFLEDSDYLRMLSLIKEAAKIFGFTMFSLVLMLTHIHLLLKLSSANLAMAMQYIFQRYAIYFNNKYNRKGHVFCGAYRSRLCFDEDYLLAASLYIHLNPIRAGLVKNPADYRWSSCSLFLKDSEVDTFIDYKFVLNILDEDIAKARLKYKELLLEADALKFKNTLEKFAMQLKNKKRLKNPKDIEARKILIEQLKSRGFNMSEIAEELNLTRQTVHNYFK